ncbi:hypothetical protein DVH24_007794 [Malus domestica]|uniref:Uncharacterized protein n=1 Tax=Malus domestica TaxID=3750 RepID=A0A498JNX5_MALDO|nr:hypothetical protein DVH24_007794 [Malus domestica]
MMVMASNSNEYVVVGRAKYKELWIEDNVMRALILMQGIMAFPGHFLRVRQLAEKENDDLKAFPIFPSKVRYIIGNIRDKATFPIFLQNFTEEKSTSNLACKSDGATGGKESGDVEDMFVDDVGRGSSSAGLDFSNDMQNVEHGQWHGGVDVSKRNSKHVNENDRGNEDDVVLESCYGKAN